LFAGVLLLVSGFWNLIYGIAAIANSHVFVANAHYVFGNLRAWGWVTLIFAILLLIAGGGIMVGNQMARWFGVVVLGLNLIEQMFSIPSYPFWSLTIIALDVVALYGLCAYGSRENVEAAVQSGSSCLSRFGATAPPRAWKVAGRRARRIPAAMAPIRSQPREMKGSRFASL
jgi:hypothetical protein